jgi:hypothetical protein
MQTTSLTPWRKACLDTWPDTKLANLLGAHSVSNFHFIPANSMHMQIPDGRMLFHLAKALSAIWSSVTMLSLVGKPHLLLSLQCLPPRQNSLPFVLALLMSRIAAKLPMNLALQLRPTVIHEDNLGAKAIAENGNFKGRSNHLSFDAGGARCGALRRPCA